MDQYPWLLRRTARTAMSGSHLAIKECLKYAETRKCHHCATAILQAQDPVALLHLPLHLRHQKPEPFIIRGALPIRALMGGASWLTDEFTVIKLLPTPDNYGVWQASW